MREMFEERKAREWPLNEVRDSFANFTPALPLAAPSQQNPGLVLQLEVVQAP